MENQHPSRPVKTKQTFKPLPNEIKKEEIAVLTNLEPEENKYAKKVKVGSVKTIGRSPSYVESVGLGSLRVLTSNGFQSEQPEGTT
jgi:hypothetical protein